MPHIIAFYFILICRNVSKGNLLLTNLLSVLINRKFYSRGIFSTHLWSPKCLLQRKKNYDEILKNQKHCLQTSGIIYSISFICKAMDKSAFDLFPLDISKEHKVISNKLSRILLLIIKLPNHLFLVTLILSRTINAQLNHTERALSVHVKIM